MDHFLGFGIHHQPGLGHDRDPSSRLASRLLSRESIASLVFSPSWVSSYREETQSSQVCPIHPSQKNPLELAEFQGLSLLLPTPQAPPSQRIGCDGGREDKHVYAQPRDGLPYSAGNRPIEVVHYSFLAGLSTLDLAFFGRGKANRNDLAGLPKLFFYVKGSPIGADTALFQGAYAYAAKLPGGRLYDTRKGRDPLGYWDELNRVKRDLRIKRLGYLGVLVSTGAGDGRVCALVFEPVKVRPIVRTSLTNAR